MMLLWRTVSNREPFRVYLKLYFEECQQIGIDSMVLVLISATFMGAVTAVQTRYNLHSPLIPVYLVATAVRDMTILELAPTVVAVIFAGKVGSNIAGQLGTMRITEQIDALEVMGINSASYLILPKILACMTMYPLLVIIAIFLSISGGYVAGTVGNLYSEEDYIYGIRYGFIPYNIMFALVKAVTFAFLISTISAYKGYFTNGGALEVGIASTNAVTNSCIAILLADYFLAELLI